MTEEIKNKIPEELLDLLMVVFIYINSVSGEQNPFVRTFGESEKEAAFELLVSAANEASYLFTEVENLNKTRMEEINKEEKEFLEKQHEE